MKAQQIRDMDRDSLVLAVCILEYPRGKANKGRQVYITRISWQEYCPQMTRLENKRTGGEKFGPTHAFIRKMAQAGYDLCRNPSVPSSWEEVPAKKSRDVFSRPRLSVGSDRGQSYTAGSNCTGNSVGHEHLNGFIMYFDHRYGSCWR